jgi:hypothetical protein
MGGSVFDGGDFNESGERMNKDLTQEEQKIFEELVKATQDVLVFNTSMVEVTKDSVRHVPFGSEEFEEVIKSGEEEEECK